jgi:benzaldehyde dehydrogenase (NAD)
MEQTKTLLFDLAQHAEQIFSTGWRPGSGNSVPVTDKASGHTLLKIGIADGDDVARAAVAARNAQRAWEATPPASRADVLRRFAANLESHLDELAGWIVRESGSIRPKAEFEVATSIREALEVSGLAGRSIGEILPSSTGRTSYARRVPLGVVGVITPWNSPLLLALRAVLPALVLGNAVVLKPDVQTSVSGGLLIARAFEEAGLPEGLLHVLPGGAETGEALVAHPDVAMISFTGSTAVGRRVGEIAGRLLKRTALELGGNNALIVFDDVDIEAVTSAAAFGSFFHQGQICFSTGRHLVHANIATRYAEALARRANALHAGDPSEGPVHLGPLINLRQAERAQRFVASSIQQGAQLLAGGGTDGVFMQATVLANVTPRMPAFSEEVFGPVAPITVFHTEDEAIELANQTEYGLVASVFTQDLARGMRVAAAMKTGIVHINDQTISHDVYAPIGGRGASGNTGRSGIPAALDEYTQWQWVTVGEGVPHYPF